MLPQAHSPGRGPNRPPAPSKCHGWGAKGALRCSGVAPSQLDTATLASLHEALAGPTAHGADVPRGITNIKSSTVQGEQREAAAHSHVQSSACGQCP